ncbi:serine/threonine protein kinase [Nitzschia inconspicua]|uniref:Serine/threonine protein kinase n=1 Tax=Nitzschia inconspicua TaxID=303405 RepID=A0A9K3PN75_9STRA|nr:serine/threonine protein kinase [Nitzschia inconspicua]
MNGLQWNPFSPQQMHLDQFDEHATLRYDDVAAAGPAARPLDFPAPTVYRATFVDVPARDHRSGSIHHLNHVLMRTNNGLHANNSVTNGCSISKQPATAYLPIKKLAKSIYGSVKLCIVLKRIENSQTNHCKTPEGRQDYEDDLLGASASSNSLQWESTDYLVAIKFSEWKRIHQLRGKHLEDPIKECAALQLVGNYHPHVIGALEILQDDHCLYTVMPYLGGGDLYGRLLGYVGYRSTGDVGGKGNIGFDENLARMWFRQLLLAVDHLQKKGVCHRDISLENLILDKDDKLCLVDFGMALRVPYTDKYGGGVTDVSAGTSRRLMVSQGQGGKLMYAAPEIIAQQTEVDPFATDLWSVGVVLFVMLVGLAPFKWAHPSDKRFASISKGGLKKLVEALDIPISAEAIDLLQGFLLADPRQRWTLAEAMQHPWVLGKKFTNRPSTFPSTSKNSAIGAPDMRNTKNRHARKSLSPTKSFRRNNKHASPAECHRNMYLLSSQT